MSWNIQKPGDYLNGPLTVMGNVGIGTTTFTSIAGYTSLKINNATNGAILDLAQGDAYKGRVIGSLNGLVLESAAGLPVQIQVGGLNSFKVDPAGVFIWYDGAGGVNQRMQLNATGLGIGAAPELKLRVDGPDAAPATSGSSVTNGAFRIGAVGGSTNLCVDSGVSTTGGAYGWFQARSRSNYALNYDIVLNPNGGNVGIGVTPAGTGGCLQLKSGITLPAAQVASTDANTLDDYEEGTFTPIVRGSTTSGTGTYTTQFGRYTKVGRLVTVSVTLVWTAHTGTGNLQFAGLPFTSANTASAYDGIAIAYQSNISSAANTVLYGLIEFGSTVVTMTGTPVAGGSYGLVAMDTAGEIAFTATYTV